MDKAPHSTHTWSNGPDDPMRETQRQMEIEMSKGIKEKPQINLCENSKEIITPSILRPIMYRKCIIVLMCIISISIEPLICM